VGSTSACDVPLGCEWGYMYPVSPPPGSDAPVEAVRLGS